MPKLSPSQGPSWRLTAWDLLGAPPNSADSSAAPRDPFLTHPPASLDHTPHPHVAPPRTETPEQGQGTPRNLGPTRGCPSSQLPVSHRTGALKKFNQSLAPALTAGGFFGFWICSEALTGALVPAGQGPALPSDQCPLASVSSRDHRAAHHPQTRRGCSVSQGRGRCRQGVGVVVSTRFEGSSGLKICRLCSSAPEDRLEVVSGRGLTP